MISDAQSAAIAAIRKLADQNNLAVAIVTADDVLLLKGVEDPNPEQVAAVVNSYEWRHYSDNWADRFEGLTLGEHF